MGLVDSIKKLFGDPKHVTRLDDLETGQVIVDGEVRLADGGALTSPIKGLACVAFTYRALHQTPGRGSAALQVRPLRSVEGFAPFELELDGGRVDAVPQTPGGFSKEEHQKLAGAGYQHFQAVEEVVTARTRVRLRGVARRKGDAWTITYRRIEKLGSEGKKARPAAKKAKRAR